MQQGAQHGLLVVGLARAVRESTIHDVADFAPQLANAVRLNLALQRGFFLAQPFFLVAHRVAVVAICASQKPQNFVAVDKLVGH
ncbi:hypothetical protein AWC04_13980 [Mycolicibacterium fallax]|uniref:Uncharacterized protein n=1 Tax=Mycolicibacterium fallax TaxID=1793 RepID=A0A1X1R807_MYCFA|nr:hypothetical protein AWC04_13980 [Mycolicibacterium fallax]